MNQEPYSKINYEIIAIKVDQMRDFYRSKIHEASQNAPEHLYLKNKSNDEYALEFLTDLKNLGMLSGHVYMTASALRRFNKYKTEVGIA